MVRHFLPGPYPDLTASPSLLTSPNLPGISMPFKMSPFVFIVNVYHALAEQRENLENLYVHASHGWPISPNESLSSFRRPSSDKELQDVLEVQELGLTGAS